MAPCLWRELEVQRHTCPPKILVRNNKSRLNESVGTRSRPKFWVGFIAISYPEPANRLWVTRLDSSEFSNIYGPMAMISGGDRKDRRL